jgi:hypothetical protein
MSFIKDAIAFFKDWKNKGVVLAQSFGVPSERVISDGTDNVHVYLNDPTTPDLMATVPFPKETRLPLRSVGAVGGGWPLGTIQQQSAATLVCVNNALTYMASKSPKEIKGWAAINTLSIMCRAGKDINAYYDRGALKFFFFPDPAMHKMIFACDARTVTAHEFGHAFLDILRPDFWNTQALEIWALHEAFGDMTALLDGLQMDALVDRALHETGGDLMKSNVLTKLAAEMGRGLHDLAHGQMGELNDCLRDLIIVYRYTEPEKLPMDGMDNQLLQEPHSFSRVLSGAFYEMIVRIYEKNKQGGMDPKAALKSAGDTAAHYLLNAVVGIPVTVRAYNALCQKMLLIDKAEGGKYYDVMHQTFANRTLLMQNVMMLDNVTLGDVTKGLKEPFEVQVHGGSKIVRTLATKEVVLADHLGGPTNSVQAQAYNPLLKLKIEVPVQATYYFDHQDKLVDVVNPHEAEIIDAAYNCLEFLHKKGLVGSHNTALFEEKYGKLVRKQIVCCGRPNYCDPNAPEFGKPWKPRNNSGCSVCHGDCDPLPCLPCNPEMPAPKVVKKGCFTSVRSGQARTYRSGGSNSIKVC